MTANNISAIYDFELFPYALGDVLTWNVRSAMQCEMLGRDKVDIYICLDERYPSGIYQRGLITEQNYELFFSELYSAFGTHPRLGNIFIYRTREELLGRLQELVNEDPIHAEAVGDYLSILNCKVSETLLDKVWRTVHKAALGNNFIRESYRRFMPSQIKEVVRKADPSRDTELNDYFVKYIHSHESINEFAEQRGSIPLLKPAPGCAPDIEEITQKRFVGKKIVPFHLRLRRLDVGYGGEHSYDRDSDFLEWYDFLRETAEIYPEIEFIALGRLQEKPMALMDLPNITSLRSFGMGLGHELTLMLQSDLFIGTSSGFATLANFSTLPYFITKMNPGACHAYAIPEGEDGLPFATDRQKLIYEKETSELLMRLLRQGLDLPQKKKRTATPISKKTDRTEDIDVHGWMNRRTRPANPASTTARFTEDAAYEDAETAFLLLANIEHVRQCLLNKLPDDATTLMRRLDENFHEICNRLPQFRDMWDIISAEQSDPGSMHSVLVTQCSGYTGIVGAACTDDPIDEGGWRPANSAFHGASAKPLPGDHQSFSIQTASANGYWHTDKFIADSPNGNITVCFDAKNTEKPSQHRSWIFENGGYRVGGEFVALTEWQNFCVPILTRPNCILEFQIDQQEDDQWLMIRNFHILGAADLAFKERDTLTIPVSEWTSVGVEDAGAEMPSNYGDNCRQWRIVGDNPFLHSPILPKPGKAGLLFHFEARCDQASSEFSQCYIIQGPGQHRLIGHCAFDESWQQYRLFLEDETSSQAKVQIDCPKDVGTFAIRNVNVTPVDWDNS